MQPKDLLVHLEKGDRSDEFLEVKKENPLDMTGAGHQLAAQWAEVMFRKLRRD